MKPLVCILRCDITLTRLGFITLFGNKRLSLYLVYVIICTNSLIIFVHSSYRKNTSLKYFMKKCS